MRVEHWTYRDEENEATIYVDPAEDEDINSPLTTITIVHDDDTTGVLDVPSGEMLALARIIAARNNYRLVSKQGPL